MASGVQADAIPLKGGHLLLKKREWPENEQRMLFTEKESMF
jgi:hypothetical protein